MPDSGIICTGMSFTAKLFLLSLSLGLALAAQAQTDVGALKGTISDPAEARVTNARVILENPLTGRRSQTTSDNAGEFVLENVPYGAYLLRIEAVGFQPFSRDLSVRSNVPAQLAVVLRLGTSEQSITVKAPADLVQQDLPRTETVIDETAMDRLSPEIVRRNQLQSVVASTPGWSTENDGILHVRGVDDGVLYVVDGVPTPDRADSLFGSPFQTEAISSVDVITGNIPAEFGDRSGAVVIVQPKSGLDASPEGTLTLGAGNFRSAELAASLSAGTRRWGFTFAGEGNRSDRYLDPVDPRSLHDDGGVVSLFGRADWHPTANDTVILDLAADGSKFDVPNTVAQQLAGQDQRQQLHGDHQAVSWQHTWSASTLTNFAWFRHAYSAELRGSPFDTPLFADQDRSHSRIGALASVTRALRGHTLKAGAEGSRVALDETFNFAITDARAAEIANLSPQATAFTSANPFLFAGRTTRGVLAGYLQDDFSPLRHLTVNAGARFDYTDVLVSDHQLSPRVGAVYYVERTRSALRASVNRLYMPPQAENLLLASSLQARSLSPFNLSGGGAAIPPEKLWASEAGISQQLPGRLRLNAAYWWRRFRNIDDPNVLFSTTIIFPNSVARARARGVDVRLDVPERHGWSAYVSYTNSRITEVGPLNGGLFLTDDFLEIGPGTEFTPDHDQRNSGSFAVSYARLPRSLWLSLSGRYESGVPIDLPTAGLAELRNFPGFDLVNVSTGRVKPWAVFGLAGGMDLLTTDRVTTAAMFNVQNLANRSFVFNFGNPFSGTHFGYPRLWAASLRFRFR
jgi:hypothetical protein